MWRYVPILDGMKKPKHQTPESAFIADCLRSAGGYAAVASALSEMTGQELTYEQVKAWRRRGNIPAKFIPAFSALSGIKPEKLNPLFAVRSAA
jgi:hypothetical protein